jgi:hypothetical protein
MQLSIPFKNTSSIQLSQHKHCPLLVHHTDFMHKNMKFSTQTKMQVKVLNLEEVELNLKDFDSKGF